MGKICKIGSFTLLILIWFEGIVVVPGVTVAKAVGIIVGFLWIMHKLGEIATTKKIVISNRELIFYIFLIIYFMITVTSLYFVGDIYLNRIWFRISNLFLLISMVIILSDQIKTEKDYEIAYKIIVYSGILVSFLIIIQYYFGISLSNIFSYQESIFTQKDIIRAIGPFRDPNFASLNIVTLFPLTYFYTIGYLSGKRWRNFLILGIAIEIIAILLSFSRAGLIALLFAFLLIIISEKINIKIYFLIILLLIIIISFLPLQEIKDRSSSVLKFYQNINNPYYLSITYPSLWNRYNFMIGAWKMFKDNLIIGVGFGNFMYNIPQYSLLSVEAGAHNTYLELAAELGIFGAIVFLILLYLCWKNINISLKLCNNKNIIPILKGLKIGFLVYLFGALFLTAPTEKILWITFALSISITKFNLKSRKK